MKKNILLTALISISATLYAATDATWIPSGNGYTDVSTNWSGGVTNPDGNITITTTTSLRLRNGGTQYSMNGIIITGTGLTVSLRSADAQSLVLGSEGINLNGTDIDLTMTIALDITKSQTWNIGSNLFTLTGATLISGTSTVVDVILGSGGEFVFDLAQLAGDDWTGKLNFTGDIDYGAITVASSSANIDTLLSSITIKGQSVQLDGDMIVAIPEPATYAALFALGAVAVVMYRRRKG